MTDQIQSGDQGSASGNPPASNGGVGNGSSGAPATSAPSPQTGQLDWVKAKGWVNEDGSVKTADVLNGYQTLERHLGSIRKVPDEKAKPEEWDAFYKGQGWPGDSKLYELKPPENLPEGLPYNEKLATWFREAANSQKLPAKTAQGLHDGFNKFVVEAHQEDVKAFAKQIQDQADAAMPEFVKHWGDPQSPQHLQKAEAARLYLTKHAKAKGLEGALKRGGLMTPQGTFTNFAIGDALAELGQQYLNDTNIAPNSHGHSGANPFRKLGLDGKELPTFNMTQQSALIKQNPVEARRLILEAGQKPEAFGL